MGVFSTIKSFLKRTEDIKGEEETPTNVSNYKLKNEFINELQNGVESEEKTDRKDAILQVLIDMGLSEEYINSPGARTELCDVFDEMLTHKFGGDFEICLTDRKIVEKVQSAIREADWLFDHKIICVYEKQNKDTGEITKKYRGVGFMTESPTGKRVSGPFGQPIYKRTTTLTIEKPMSESEPANSTKQVISEKVTETGIVFERRETTSNRSKDAYETEEAYTVRTSRIDGDLDAVSVQLDCTNKRGYDEVTRESRFSIRNDERADITDISLPLSNEQLKEMLIRGDIAISNNSSIKRYEEVQEKINSMVPEYSKRTREKTVCKGQKEKVIKRAMNSKNPAVKDWLVIGKYCEKAEFSNEIYR